ncbi:hypothetical protein AVEN_188415-1 [Araneus ventricosus]|uniref:Uncharacterized protein n=2 Tax=Araneus ventricosus TaxID=182803 RepID=A0A4Y2EIU3_ARAVE|nr:hypothetical protein AVEN_6393-1 [Araneus ventricosus]GBM29060.1 hypothetical protein AVEN_236689-1 [Araneus ventricosus]GBM29278.1 hypothetical protein AVEN_188415-1 [Araneus ventricosus]
MCFDLGRYDPPVEQLRREPGRRERSARGAVRRHGHPRLLPQPPAAGGHRAPAPTAPPQELGGPALLPLRSTILRARPLWTDPGTAPLTSRLGPGPAPALPLHLRAPHHPPGAPTTPTGAAFPRPHPTPAAGLVPGHPHLPGAPHRVVQHSTRLLRRPAVRPLLPALSPRPHPTGGSVSEEAIQQSGRRSGRRVPGSLRPVISGATP